MKPQEGSCRPGLVGGRGEGRRQPWVDPNAGSLHWFSVRVQGLTASRGIRASESPEETENDEVLESKDFEII